MDLIQHYFFFGDIFPQKHFRSGDLGAAAWFLP